MSCMQDTFGGAALRRIFRLMVLGEAIYRNQSTVERILRCVLYMQCKLS